jgi:hypothetical protein
MSPPVSRWLAAGGGAYAAASSIPGPTGNDLDINAIVRNSAVGNFVRIDLHFDQNCAFWGMFTPSS